MHHGMDDRWPVILRTAYFGNFTRAKLIELLKDYQPSENGKHFNYDNLATTYWVWYWVKKKSTVGNRR